MTNAKDLDEYREISELRPLLNPKQVAALLGVSTNAVYLWAKTCRLPSVNLGKSVRFKWQVIEEVIRGEREV